MNYCGQYAIQTFSKIESYKYTHSLSKFAYLFIINLFKERIKSFNVILETFVKVIRKRKQIKLLFLYLFFFKIKI